MSWLLANVDVFKVTLIALAFVFYFLDVIFKGAFRLFPESAGADLCLAAVTLNASVLIDRFNEVTQISAPVPAALRAELYVSFRLFLVGLALWVVCLRLVAPPREARLIIPGRSSTAFSHWLASMIGLSVSVLVILLFLEV